MDRRILALTAIALLTLLLALLLAACGGAEEKIAAPATEKEEVVPSTLDGQSLVEERCTKCHDLGRVEAARKTGEGWKATVERMVENGASLNEAEQEVVAKYLTETYPQ